MSAYVIGTLVGRLLAAYLLVVGANMLIARNWRRGWLNAHRWWSWLIVTALFLVALLAHYGAPA